MKRMIRNTFLEIRKITFVNKKINNILKNKKELLQRRENVKNSNQFL